MIIEANLRFQLWDEIFKNACYTQKRSIVVKRHAKTTYKVIKGRKFDISHFHILGCLCFILNQRD